MHAFHLDGEQDAIGLLDTRASINDRAADRRKPDIIVGFGAKCFALAGSPSLDLKLAAYDSVPSGQLLAALLNSDGWVARDPDCTDSTSNS